MRKFSAVCRDTKVDHGTEVKLVYSFCSVTNLSHNTSKEPKKLSLIAHIPEFTYYGDYIGEELKDHATLGPSIDTEADRKGEDRYIDQPEE